MNVQHLTCTNEAGYSIYRSTTILFQIFFTYELITKIPREYFLPYLYNFKTKKRVSKVNIYIFSVCVWFWLIYNILRYPIQKLLEDPDQLYLVKIVPRSDLFDYVPADQLQALWYFIKQNCASRNNRIIPNLE